MYSSMLDNKFRFTNPYQISDMEERICKVKAVELLTSGDLVRNYKVGSTDSLTAIHTHLFEDMYNFAGRLRSVNMSKGNTRFTHVSYLYPAFNSVGELPQSLFKDILHKYIEMNVVHPFVDGNGRSTRIWLDYILRQELKCQINWGMINREDYLLAMERSVIHDTELSDMLLRALTPYRDIDVYTSVDGSFALEGFVSYRAADLVNDKT